MKKLLFLFLLIQPLSLVYAQNSGDNNQVFTIVQQAPKFNDGANNYFSQHLVYPQEARDKGVEGTVYVTFVVEKDGSVSGAHVLRGVEHSLDSEAVACVSAMPKWSPGIQNGNPVRVQFNVPIHFSLVDAGSSDNTANNSSTKSNGQDNSTNKDNSGSGDKVYAMAEQMPKYPHLNEYLTQHIVYPKEAISKGVEGTVKVSFTVEKDGSLSDIHVLHSLEPSLDTEAVTCLRNMPKWKPGMQNGKVVRVQFNTPVHFTLPDKQAADPVANTSKTTTTTNKKAAPKQAVKQEKNTDENVATSTTASNPPSGLDTIYMNNEKVACNVKEVTEDAVKYIYPGEETINTVFKNAIQKIVFRSGRVSTFAEATSLKKVVCVDDYDNVSFSQAESEVKGLYKMGEVSSKARGGIYADQEKVKELAIYKLKIQAAMIGANVVLLTQEATANSNAYNRYTGYNWYDNRYYTVRTEGQTTSTNMAGVAYSNMLPSYTDFEAKVNGRTMFNIIEETEFHINWSDYKTTAESSKFTITKLYNESGLIMINGFIDGEQPDSFRVISFTDTYFIVMVSNENATFNMKVNF